MITTTDALLSLKPNSEWTLRGDVLEWIDSVQTEPTQADIQAEITRLQAEYDAQEYARNRQPEYPEIGDQLDALYHAGVFPANMAARIKETKDKYPK